MSYIGDFALGDTFDTKFCTVTTTGAPTQLAGTPVISAYVGNSLTQITAGITLTVDFDGVTGLNNVRVVATSGNGYATASNYQLVITTGTVGGTSVVGYVVSEFSIEARSALRPTTAARTLDVTATGEAGIDWANIGAPTTAQNLSATNIDVDQVVASVSGAVGSVTGAVGSVTGLTNATIADAVLDEDMTAHQTLGTLGQAIGDPVADTTTIYQSVVTDAAGTNIAADIIAIEGQTDDIGVAGAGLTALGDARIANLDAAVTTRATPAQVNTEVLDVLNTDTFAEPAQGTPAATNTLVNKLSFLYKAWRNRTTQTATQYSLYGDDALTVDHKATFADDATTADRGEVATGP